MTKEDWGVFPELTLEENEEIHKAREAGFNEDHIWVCEFCFKVHYDMSWNGGLERVWERAVCPDCKIKVMGKGGYDKVDYGAYAIGFDPRIDTTQLILAGARAFLKGKDGAE